MRHAVRLLSSSALLALAVGLAGASSASAANPGDCPTGQVCFYNGKWATGASGGAWNADCTIIRLGSPYGPPYSFVNQSSVKNNCSFAIRFTRADNPRVTSTLGPRGFAPNLSVRGLNNKKIFVTKA